MSNVLIGIIGVILFIGLALAGAMFLGPEFKTSRQQGRVAQEVNRLTQMANATRMARLDNNAVTRSWGMSNFLAGGYLKVNPGNPANGSSGSGWSVRESTNITAGTNIDIIWGELPFGIENDLCSNINVQGGGPSSIPMASGGGSDISALTPTDQIYGCFGVNDQVTGGTLLTGYRYIWHRV